MKEIGNAKIVTLPHKYYTKQTLQDGNELNLLLQRLQVFCCIILETVRADTHNADYEVMVLT
jgi:antitoxin component of MazEF toxin-antitoxin module